MITPFTRQAVHQPTALGKADQKRLERLAASAGRTPQAMLRYVLRDGFAVCEEDVSESRAADEEFSRGKSVSHDNVMRAAKELIRNKSKRD